MAVLAQGDLQLGDVILTARAAELSPAYAITANDPRKELWERQEAARCAETMLVALEQPHRQGDPGKRAGDALDVFCKRMKLRRECFQAGEKYTRECRAEKSARGFHVVDQHPAEGELLDKEQLEAKREAAIIAFRSANDVLVAIHIRCPRRMELLCYDRLPPSPYDDDLLKNGLLNLARHYGLLDEGINRDRPR